MDTLEKLKKIIQNEKVKEIIPFLKSLNKEEKKKVKLALKEYQYLWEFNQKTVTQQGFSYQQPTTPKGTEQQKLILTALSFVCHDQREFQREWSRPRKLDLELLNGILPWYIPSWFNKYVNEISKEGWASISLSYHDLVELENKGYCTLSPEIIVNKILIIIREHIKLNHKFKYTPEALWRETVTLEKHIWYLFEYESGIHLSDQYTRYDENEEKSGWRDSFKILVDLKKIDRFRVLKESLLASNRNFNKNQSGWFISLFWYLDPETHELMALQQELFSLFISPHSKVINEALKGIKQMVTEPDFKYEDFLDSSAILLSSETKSMVNSTLMVLDKIAKIRKVLRTPICIQACQTFVQKDNDLQLRASRLIAKYGDVKNEELLQELCLYNTTIMNDARVELDKFLKESIIVELEEPTIFQEESNLSLDSNNFLEIHPESDFDGFLFLASQAFDNNDPIHFELFTASLLQVQHQIHGDNIAKLEPVFQRAYKTIMGENNTRIGLLDNMLATFFMDYGKMLCVRFPMESKSIRLMFEAYRKKDRQQAIEWRWYTERLTPLNEWRTKDNTPIYFIFKGFLMMALEKLKRQDNLPLLSTPTHSPCWVDPSKLIERLGQYLQQKRNIDELDLQVAMARCLPKKEVSKDFISKHLSGEMKALFSFYLNGNHEPPDNISFPLAWQAAAITKDTKAPIDFSGHLDILRINPKYLAGELGWGASIVPVDSWRWDYINGNNKKTSFIDHQKKIILDRPTKFITPKVKGWKRLVGITPKPPKIDRFLYLELQIKEKWLEGVNTDIKRFLSLVPNHPAPLIAELMEKIFYSWALSSEMHKVILINVMEYLSEIWLKDVMILNDFLGMALMYSDKTVRTIACELWISQTSRNMLNQERIGESVAKLNENEFAPLKRFVDLVPDMYAISPAHKKAMRDLLYACLIHLPDAAPRNLKNLLLLFKETNTKIEEMKRDDGTFQSKLESWESSPTLKKVLKSF